MVNKVSELPQGAGATTASNAPNSLDGRPAVTGGRFTSAPGGFEGASRAGAVGTTIDPVPADHSLIVTSESSEGPSTAVVIGAALVGAVAGASIPFMLAGRSSSRQSAGETETVQRSVTIQRSPEEIYAFWRNFKNLPRFMDNIESVETIDERRSHWVIKAPAGTKVEFDSRIVDDVPGKLIAWESEPGASVANSGRVEFDRASAPGATVVRATIHYTPPAGTAGRLVAKLFRREPGEQAREDLARLKQLMEGANVS